MGCCESSAKRCSVAGWPAPTNQRRVYFLRPPSGRFMLRKYTLHCFAWICAAAWSFAWNVCFRIAPCRAGWAVGVVLGPIRARLCPSLFSESFARTVRVQNFAKQNLSSSAATENKEGHAPGPQSCPDCPSGSATMRQFNSATELQSLAGSNDRLIRRGKFVGL
jgi:hypothetical protein